jgi:LPXTG-motif cell wall-anchored protein
MAWNPKTVLGKVLKGVVSAAPLALSLIPGIGPAVSALTGVAKNIATKGTEKLKAASTILDGITAAGMTDPVNKNAVAMLDGSRATTNAMQVAEREALMGSAGVTTTTAIKNVNWPLIIGGGGALLALFMLMGKKRRR